VFGLKTKNRQKRRVCALFVLRFSMSCYTGFVGTNNADKAMETPLESAKRIVQDIQPAYGPCLFTANERSVRLLYSGIGGLGQCDPLTPRNEVVLIRQYRHGIGEATLEIPGGLWKKATRLKMRRVES